MQHRREAKNVETINGISKESKYREYSRTENSDSSDEYEEDTHISYQFRRWANHIWSVSNNVTSRLRDLLRNNPSSTSATSDHSETSFLDESDSTSWSSSNTAIESWDQINDGSSNQRRYHQQSKNLFQTPARENYSRCSQKYYPVTKARRTRRVPDNRVENTSAFIMGHKIATCPPVLILPRVHHGAEQQSTKSGVYHSRHKTSRYHNTHGDQYANGWYQQYHRMGRQWGYEGSRHAGYNYSSVSPRHEIPEKLSVLTDDPKVKRVRRKSAKIEPDERDMRSVKHYSTHVRDFRSENYFNRHDSGSLNYATRKSKEESLSKTCRQKDHVEIDAPRVPNHCLKTMVHSSPKKVAWDLQLSNNASQEPSYTNLYEHPTKSYKGLNTGVDKDLTDNMEIPVKDNETQQADRVVVLPDQEPNAVEASEISRDTQLELTCHLDVPGKKSDEKRNDNPASGNNGKWSSKNGVDSLLQSLRERMRTLSNVHPFAVTTKSGSTECNTEETTGLAEKECTVASCLANTCLPQSLENPHDIRTINEEGRPSFSERIQDIWQNGPEAWKSATSPDHKTSTSRYDLHSGKNVSSKLSLFGLNGHPLLREYLNEHDSTVTLARILEKLIDSKTKSESSSQRVISEAPKPPPRSCRKQSNASPRVNVGVQKSVRTSTTGCQEPAVCSRHCSIERRKSRKRFRRTFRSHASELPNETSRPQIYSGLSITPIPSIQFPPPVRNPISNLAEFYSLSRETRPSLHCYDDPVSRHGDFVMIDNPLIDESRLAPEAGPSSSIIESSSGIKEGRQTSDAVELNRRFVNKQGQFFSLVYEKIEQERHYAKSFAADTDASQQHAPVWPKETKVLDEKRNPANDSVSAKPKSWWTKKLTFSSSRALKDKMSSLLKYVTKKHPGVDCQTQKYYFDEEVKETVMPTPPIRLRRKSTIGALKCSRSIQWDLDTSVSQYTETIDVVHGNENEKLNKSTSVSPINQRVTMASGTNTDKKKPRKTSSKLFPIQKKEVSVGPKIIQDSRGTCTDSWNELRVICSQNLVQSAGIADADEKLASFNKPSLRDILQFAEEDIKPLTDPVRKKEKNFTEEPKFKVSRSVSSKIPLATKPGSPFNALSRIHRKRPSTAPMLDSLSSSSPLNESVRALEPVRAVGKEYASPNNAKKMFFKHNRCSLLRANNSVARKSATAGQSNMWMNTTRHKNIEKGLVFEDSTSPVQIVEEKSFPELPAAEATPCERYILEKLEDSGNKTEGADSKKSSDEEAGNLAHCKGEERTLNDKTSSLDVRPCTSHASKMKENSMMNMQAQESLGDHESVIEKSVNLLEGSASCKISPRLPDTEDEANCGKFEKLPIQVNIRKDKPCDWADFEELKGSAEIPYDSVNVSKLQVEKKPFHVENRQSESTLALRVDRMRTTFNEKTIELRPQLAHSPACNTTKYSHGFHDRQAKNIPTLKQTDPCRLLTKTVHAQGSPCSDLIPQYKIGKSIMVLGKEIVPANNESNMSSFKLPDPTDHSKNSKTEVLESEQLDPKPMKKMTTAAPRVSEISKSTEGNVIKQKRAQHRKTDAILGMVRKVLDEAIDKSVAVNRQTNFAIVSSSENIRQCISTNSEKSSDFSNDSLEAIRVQNTVNNSGDKLEGTVGNSEKAMAAKLFEMDHYITQSIITFDLTEIADQSEKLRPSIFNIRLERSGEIARSKFADRRTDELRHEKLSDSKVVDDENNCQSCQGGRSVKIDSRVLVEKVKSSIENGVPLKTITITDPSILIKHSNLILNDKVPPLHRNLEVTRSEAKETLSKKLCNFPRDVLSDTQSAGEGSQTTWASHENREIGIKELRNVLEMPTKPDSVELVTSEDRKNLASSMPGSKMTQNPTRFRGTLIPRYKKVLILLSESGCSEERPRKNPFHQI